MSMYELCYVSSAAEEQRLKQQQRTMLLALSNLSITATQFNRDKQKQKQQLQKTHLLDYAIKCFDESRPYSPYNDPINITYTPSKWLSDDIHSRPPSLTCSISSNDSSQHSKHERDSVLEISERDAYGFKQPTQWISIHKLNEINKRYKKILEKQAKKWNGLLEPNELQPFPSITPKLIRYTRKGIPHHLRAKAWMHYSGAKQKMDNNAGVYSSLLQEIEAGNVTKECLDSIKKDLHRTFPENIHFVCDLQCDSDTSTMNPKLQKLQRILCAFSLYSPQIGYCQSLNFLTGFLLLFEDEEQVFWMLVTIVHDYFPPGMFDRVMEGGNLEQTVLMSMVYEMMPGVWSKISNQKCFWECEHKDNLPTITLVTGHWFLTMFINILPVETVLRIWDCFFIEGFKVLYQAALTIVKLNEQEIMFVEDSVDTIQILQKMPQKLVDCHRFMESVFSKNGVAYEMTVKDINKKRDFFRNRKRQKKANRQ